jgi:RecG-like helicase
MAVLSKIGQRSALMLQLLQSVYLHLSSVIYSKVVVSIVHQKMWEASMEDFIRDFRVKE